MDTFEEQLCLPHKNSVTRRLGLCDVHWFILIPDSWAGAQNVFVEWMDNS